jgi:hypothetical protein
MAKNPARGHNIIAKNVIPNLVGMTRTTAQSLLSSLGFTYTETSENTANEAENNTVSSQGINSGNTELLGTNVPYTYKTFSFAPFGFAPFGFTPFGAFAFTPVAFSFVTFSFTPFGAFGFLNFGFSPSQCIHEDTLINTPNGLIPIKNLNIGDQIYSIDSDSLNKDSSINLNSLELMSKGFSITEIDNIVISEKDTVLSFNNEDFKVSQEQPIFIKRDGIYGVISAGLVDESDYLIKINNSGEIEEVKVNFIQTYSGNFNVYSISLNENSWYVAGDYLVHTK